jgi:hypothetical protein
VVASIVQQLGGAEATFRRLWAAATNESPAPTEHEREDSTFLARYRELVAEYYGTLRVPHIERQYRASIDDVFVSPRLVKDGDPSPTNNLASIDVVQFDKQVSRTVLLGNPGSGKSTLCQMLMRLHAIHADFAPSFIVPVREFAAEFPPARSVVAFIESRLEAVFQSRPPQGVVERQLVGGPTVVIFDGLDEVVNAVPRAEVASIIELFAAEYPLTQVLVTSRVVGYSQAGLDPHAFTTYRILEFDDTQVAQYARRWFAQDSDLTAVEAETLTRAFLRESADLSDLRASPLLLAILCALYRKTRSLPRSRPQVYERLAVLMFEGWDRSRGIEVPLHARPLVAPVLRNLAFKMLRNDQREIGERDLLRVTKEFLQERAESSDEAEQSARELLDFFRSRAWVLTSASGRPDGEETYRFFHRTFMEYLVAQQLVRSFGQPEQIARELMVRVSAPQWTESGKLAVQLIDQSLENGAARVVESLLDQSKELGPGKRDLVLSFLVETSDVTDLPTPLRRRLFEATESSGGNIRIGATVSERDYEQASPDLDVNQWTSTSAVPHSVGDALNTVRGLLRQSHTTPDLALVAVTWIWATFEASLRGCLPSNDNSPRDPVDTAVKHELITAEEARHLGQVYRLRSSIAHGQLPSKVTRGSAVRAVKIVHNAISTLYERAANKQLEKQAQPHAATSPSRIKGARNAINLHDYFNTLLSDSVNLSKPDLEILDQLVEKIYATLVADSVLGPYVRGKIPHGSWAHQTIIKPQSGKEFDADILLWLDEHPQWSVDPGRYLDEVRAALSRNSLYKDVRHSRRSRCVRLTYAKQCHVDIAPYLNLPDGRQVIVNQKSNGWEDTNPNGFTLWVRDKDKITSGNLRQVIRLLKFLRDHRRTLPGTPSIILTTLVGNMVDESKEIGDAGYYADVPTTLRNITRDLDTWLQQNATRPSIENPSRCGTTFDHRWDDTTYDKFRDKMNTCAAAIHDAYQETRRTRSIELWQDIFGDGFKAPRRKSPTDRSALSRPGPEADRV